MSSFQTATAKPGRGRPPKLIPGHGETRKALITVGMALLTEKGYSATGIDEIIQTVSVPKGSFYHYFSSKDAFGQALIEAYSSYFVQKLDRWFLDPNLTPLERLKAFIADARSSMERLEFRRGCLIGNLGQEMGALPEKFRSQLQDTLRDWQRRTEACLRLAQAAGEIRPDVECARLAAVFWIGWEGAVLRAKLERSSEALDLFAEMFISGIVVRPLGGNIKGTSTNSAFDR